MKIGILTLHYGCNYGGVLQCYALQTYLRSQGHETEVIDYVPAQAISPLRRIVAKLRTISSVSDLLHNLCDLIKVSRNCSATESANRDRFKALFNDFRARRLTLSPRVDETTIQTLADRYDAVIVGSDQVWTGLYSPHKIYFLDWLGENTQCRRLAYAACSAHGFVRGGRTRAQLRLLLGRMNGIGVRDTTTGALVKSVDSKLGYTLVADPTMLCDFDDFASTAVPRHPYILTYILGTEIEGGHADALRMLKAEYGDIPVLSLVVPESASGIGAYSDEVIADATPELWVDLIRHASAVYTDSFHGIMFSIKFHRPFFAYYANAVRSSRLTDLKKRYPELPIYGSVPESIRREYDCDIDAYIENSKAFLSGCLYVI